MIYASLPPQVAAQVRVKMLVLHLALLFQEWEYSDQELQLTGVSAEVLEKWVQGLELLI